LQWSQNDGRICSNAKDDEVLYHCDIRTIQEQASHRRIGRTTFCR
jgi:hypothetical protein